MHPLHTLTHPHTPSHTPSHSGPQERAASQSEAHPGATLTAVQKAVAELWQVEARWRVLGLPKALTATELMTELKDNPPLPGTSPLGTKGMMAAEVAKQESNMCGKLVAYLPVATREAAARSAQQGRRRSQWGVLRSRRLSAVSAAEVEAADDFQSEVAKEKRDTLTQMPLLAGTSEDTIESLLPLMDTIDIDTAGFELIKAGAVPSHFYILVEGDVEVVLKSGRRVAKLSGQHKNAASSYPFFGEIGMLAQTSAMAAVKTSCACTLLGVTRTNFPAFLGLVPDLAQRITAIGSLRAKQAAMRPQVTDGGDATSSESEDDDEDNDSTSSESGNGYDMEESTELAALRPIYQSLDVDNSGSIDEWELWHFIQKGSTDSSGKNASSQRSTNRRGGFAACFNDVMSFDDVKREMALVDE